MNLWVGIKKFFIKNKILIIEFQLFIFVILFGVLGKIFFSFREYFWYAFFVTFIFLLIFIYFIRKNNNFKKVYFEASDEYLKFVDEIKKKPDKYHIDLIIKILSIIILFIILAFTLYGDKKNLRPPQELPGVSAPGMNCGNI